MTLDVYYPANIRNALRSAMWAGEATANAGVVSSDYMNGYRAALETIALAFGLGEVLPMARIERRIPVRVLEVEG